MPRSQTPGVLLLTQLLYVMQTCRLHLGRDLQQAATRTARDEEARAVEVHADRLGLLKVRSANVQEHRSVGRFEGQHQQAVQRNALGVRQVSETDR